VNRTSPARGRWLSIIVVCAFVCLLAFAGLSASAGIVIAQDNTTDNETIEHEHPDDAAADGDDDRISEWLAGELSRALGDSTVELSEGQYDAARGAVGDDYDERLGQYFEVAGDTDDPDDTQEEAETYEEVREQQAQLATLFEEFNETLDAYEEARDAGETEEARELARELVELVDEIEEIGGEITLRFDRLSERDTVDLSDASQSISDQTNESRTIVTTITDEEFDNTVLTATVEDPSGSFLDPLTIDLALTTEDGDPVANESIAFEIGDDRSIEAETDVDGKTTITYRPVTPHLTNEILTVRFLPTGSSPYFNSEDNVSVSLEQTTATLDIEDAPETVGFGDELTSTVAATVEDTEHSPDRLQLQGTVDSVDLGTERISSGTTQFSQTVPASIEPGEYELEFTSRHDDRAVIAESTTQMITVTETETTLSLSGTHDAEEGTLRFSGSFETEDGEPIAGETLRVLYNGENSGTVETNEDGEFRQSFSVDDKTEYNLSVVYESDGTNLVDTTADTTVPGIDPSATSTSAAASSAIPTTAVAAAVVLTIVTIAGAGIVLWRRRTTNLISGGPVARSSQPQTTGSAATAESEPTDTATTTATLTAGLDTAAELATENPEQATRVAYSVVRSHLQRHVDTPGLTHWEFYNAYQSNGATPEQAAALDQLTATFEQAAFAPTDPTESDVTAAIETARQLS